MKKKGFTLIELIVVIAIIGVLAAILVPAMLGYVRKSKITTANTTAKSIYNAFNTALVDMDTIDDPQTGFAGPKSGSDFAGATGFNGVVYGYFTDIVKVEEFYVAEAEGACVGVGVRTGKKYPGAYPNAWTPEKFKEAGNKVASAQAAYEGMNAAKDDAST